MMLKNFENLQLILPTDERITYMGRIDWTNKWAPVFVFPYSMFIVNFTGTQIHVVLDNHRACWNNFLGVIIDGEQKKVLLPENDLKTCVTLADDLQEGHHELILFKRMDSCHTWTFHGLYIDESAEVLPPEPLPDRKIEVYGDSVSAGEVSEAVDYAGKPDPEHQGEFSNSWYAYTALTARMLGAQLHDIAQGGIALMDQTGWFCAPDYVGMESVWDKIQYHPELGVFTSWDFSKYTPHVVVIAIGQNDSHPEDYMAEDYNSEKSVLWRKRYRSFAEKIRNTYPKALIILATTILEHDANWDKSIDAVCTELKDEKIVHFLYSNNGTGTPGHIRIPEAKKMAQELAAFIESFGEDIWIDE